MHYKDRPPYDMDNWRFRRTCENFHPDPDPPSIGALILDAFIIAIVVSAFFGAFT